MAAPRCWPWAHRYRPVAVEQTEDVSFGRPGIVQSLVLHVCTRCPAARTESLEGAWNLSDVATAGTSPLYEIEQTLRQYGQRITRDGLAVDLERALVSALATPAVAQRDQLARIDVALREHDHVVTTDLAGDVDHALTVEQGRVRYWMAHAERAAAGPGASS